MTIIFSSIPEDGSYPFIVADMLVSSSHPTEDFEGVDGRREAPKQVSFVGTPYKGFRQKFLQKLYVMHPHLAFAFKGDLKDARHFVSELERLIEEQETNSVNAKELLEHAWNWTKGMRNGQTPNLSIVALYYDESLNKVISYQQKCSAEHYPLAGTVTYDATNEDAIKFMRNHAKDIASESATSNHPSLKSISRAMRLGFGLFSEAVLGDKMKTTYEGLIGGFYEFCYFDHTAKTFKYVDGQQILYWPCSLEDMPYCRVMFGYFPRETQSKEYEDFRIWQVNYSNAGMRISTYLNREKIENGHRATLIEQEIERFSDKCIYPIAPEHINRFSYNHFYLLNYHHPFLHSSFIRILNDGLPLHIQKENESDLYSIIFRNGLLKYCSLEAQEFAGKRWEKHAEDRIRELSQIPESHNDMVLLVEYQNQAQQYMNHATEEAYKLAAKFYGKASQLTKNHKIYFFTANFVYQQGIAETYLEHFEEASKLLTKANRLFRDMPHLELWVSTLNSIGVNYKNQYAKAHKKFADNFDIEKGDKIYRKASKALDEAIAISEHNHMHKNLAITRANLASLFLQGGWFDDALARIDQAIAYASNPRNNEEQRLSRYYVIKADTHFLGNANNLPQFSITTAKNFLNNAHAVAQKYQMIGLVKEIEGRTYYEPLSEVA